jgi:hypothetical protein
MGPDPIATRADQIWTALKGSIARAQAAAIGPSEVEPLIDAAAPGELSEAPGELLISTVTSADDIAAALRAPQEGAMHCFVLRPAPPSVSTPFGGAVTAYGAVGCDTAANLGIRVCIRIDGNESTCQPAGSGELDWTFGTAHSGWASEADCIPGARYETVVYVEARRGTSTSADSQASQYTHLCF